LGIGNETLGQLLHFKREGLLDGVRSVCELGSQEMYCGNGETLIDELLAAFGQPPAPAETVRALADKGSGRDFFKLLGLTYSCIDTDGRFGAMVLDLNYDSVSKEHRNRYDLVTNLGTSGGYMYHEVPFTGYVTHGLVTYTPKWFWMLCRSNFYDYVRMWIDAEAQKDFLHSDILGDPKIIVRTSKENFSQQDSLIRCLLRKRFDIPYVPPLDGDVGGMNAKARQRYWTVVDPESYARVAAEQPPPGNLFLQLIARLFRRW
jgi:hypothetical protein